MPKTTMTKKVGRQLRLTTPVNAKEKKIAERLARDEGYPSVAELVRQLIADRHERRMKLRRAKKERDAKKKASGRSATKLLSLGKTGASTKPSRSNTASNRASRRTTSRTTKKAGKRRVVSAAGNTSRTTGNRTKASASADRSA